MRSRGIGMRSTIPLAAIIALLVLVSPSAAGARKAKPLSTAAAADKGGAEMTCDACITLAEALHERWGDEQRRLAHGQRQLGVDAATLTTEMVATVGAVCSSHWLFGATSAGVTAACHAAMGTRYANSAPGPHRQALAELLLGRAFPTVAKLVHAMCMKGGVLGRVCRGDRYTYDDPPPPMISTVQEDDTVCMGCMRVAGRLHFLARRSVLADGRAVSARERRAFLVDTILEEQLCHHSAVLPSVHTECEDVRDAILEDARAMDQVEDALGISDNGRLSWMSTSGRKIMPYPMMVTKVCVKATQWCLEDEMTTGTGRELSREELRALGREEL